MKEAGANEKLDKVLGIPGSRAFSWRRGAAEGPKGDRSASSSFLEANRSSAFLIRPEA